MLDPETSGSFRWAELQQLIWLQMKITITDKLMSLTLVSDNHRKGQRTFQHKTGEDDELELCAAEGKNNLFNFDLPANDWTHSTNAS